MKKPKSIEELDYNEIVIRWADIIILNSTHLGHVSRDSFMYDYVFDLHPPTPEEIEFRKNDPARKIRDYILSQVKEDASQLDFRTNAMTGYLGAVKNHLLAHGYIKEPNHIDRFWTLSEKGELVKELGGHVEYTKYRKRQLNILKNQTTINVWLIIATGLAALMPFVIALWLQKDAVVNVPPQQNPHVEFRIDSGLLQKIVEDILKSKDTMKKELPQKKGQSPKSVSQ